MGRSPLMALLVAAGACGFDPSARGPARGSVDRSPDADAGPSVATVTPIQVRKAATIVEQPTAGNGFTTVVELDDTGESGSDTYVVEVEIAPE